MIQLGDPEELEAKRRPAPVAGEEGDGGGEATARALAADGHPVGIDAEGVRGGMHPLEGGVAVVDPGGEGVLGGEPVLGRHDDGTDVAGDLGGEPVLHLDGADDEAAAVDVEQRRPRRGDRGGGCVDADRDRPPGAGDLVVADRHPGGVDVAGQGLEQGQDAGTGLGHIPQVPLGEEIDDGREFGIDVVGHGSILA